MQTRDGRWVRTGPGVLPGPADTSMAYGRGWANLSNTPFREYEHCPRMPVDVLDVGSDKGGAVGTSPAPFFYSGTIEALVIEVDR